MESKNTGKRLTSAEWAKLQARYASEEISLRQLSSEAGVTFASVGKRAEREGWTAFAGSIQATARAAAERGAVRAAEKAGEKLGLSAAKLDARSLSTVEKFLDRVDAELAKPDPSPEVLKDVMSVFRGAVETGRKVHRMDTPEANKPEPIIDIRVLARLANDPTAVREISDRPPVQSLPQAQQPSLGSGQVIDLPATDTAGDSTASVASLDGVAGDAAD